MSTAGVPAEQLAVKMIVRALDNVTRPDLPRIVEVTGLEPSEVKRLAEAVLAKRQAVIAPGTPKPPTASSPGWSDPAGANHAVPMVRDLYRKALAATQAYYAALDAPRTKAAIRRAALVEELAQLDAVLGNKCADCGQVTSNAAGLAIHRARRHTVT